MTTVPFRADQTASDTLDNLRLADFRPRAEVRLPEHLVPKPRFPVIDIHNHLGRPGGSPKPAAGDPVKLVALLDEMGVELMVDLDGCWGELLDQRRAAFEQRFPGRFLHFARVDWEAALAADDPGAFAAAQLRDGIQRGARGLKVWKDLGLTYRDRQNQLVAVDDPRLDPLWATAGELGAPVLIHVGDPAAFFRPLDATNERIEQLTQRPDWHFYPDFPSLEELIGQFERVVLRHRDTVFIGAHVGCYAEDLGRVRSLLDQAPNYHIDISARHAELGRQPRMTRALIDAHPDRVLFGTDHCGNPAMNAIFYRFLETEDEYFPYRPDPDDYGTGRWRIYGLGLPDDLLRAIYRDNARRLLGL